MMKKQDTRNYLNIAFKAFTLLLMIVSLASNTSAETNLIANPDFEIGTTAPLNWVFVTQNSLTPIWDTVSHSGLRSIKISTPGTTSNYNVIAVSNQIKVKPGQFYTFSAWAKVQSFGGSIPPAVKVVEADANTGWLRETTLKFDMNTNNWSQQIKDFQTGPNTMILYVTAGISNGYGTLWIDDVSLNLKGATFTPTPTSTPTPTTTPIPTSIPTPTTTPTPTTNTVPASSGKTYYVAKNGNDNYPGTEASPWLTIQKAANTVNPGDTVYVKAGTYANDVLFRRSGNANNYITFQNYSTDIVTITWDGDQRTHLWPDDGSAYNGGLFAFGAVSYIKIKGFRFANTGIGITVGISKGANHIIIDGNVFDDVTGAAVYTGYYKLNPNDDYAAWNIDVINNYMRRSGTGYDPNQWYAEFVSNAIVSNNNISYNTITHNGNGECLTYKEGSNNGIISFNDISNCYSASGGTAIGVADMLSQAIYVDGQEKGVKNVQVFNNIAHRTQGIFVGSEFGGIAQDISIYNNIIYDSQVAVNVVPYKNQDKSLCSNCPDPGYRNIYVYNNIGYNTIPPYGGAYGGHVYSTTPYENIVWKNNILWANKIQNEWLDGSCPSCLQGNVIEGNNFDQYGNIYDPLFVDPENHDFRLQSKLSTQKQKPQVYSQILSEFG